MNRLGGAGRYDPIRCERKRDPAHAKGPLDIGVRKQQPLAQPAPERLSILASAVRCFRKWMRHGEGRNDIGLYRGDEQNIMPFRHQSLRQQVWAPGASGYQRWKMPSDQNDFQFRPAWVANWCLQQTCNPGETRLSFAVFSALDHRRYREPIIRRTGA